jgi:SAM-dependent methyltransferase
MSSATEWTTRSGDAWAERWRETDEALADLASKLHSALLAAAPPGPFDAFDVGCGAGSTSVELARARPDARIVCCDLSPALARVAEERLAEFGARVVLGDAEIVAGREGPFDLVYSRHGVMFFEDPVRAFGKLREAARPGAALVFSCFQDWDSNPWASELASAAAGHPLPPPGREPSGFAFAEPAYVAEILGAAGWTELECRAAPFRYVAAEGDGAVEQALDLLAEIGPASRLVRSLPDTERTAAFQRMRDVLERHCRNGSVEFSAAAWIWTAKAGEDSR